MNQKEINARQRLQRIANNNAYTVKYERSPSGKLMRIYRNMVSRVTGVQKKKAHLYLGLDILPKSEFYRWATTSEDFHLLYSDWVSSGYDRKLAPTVDRVDSTRGYTLDNMEWITHSENSRRGSLSYWRQSREAA